MANEKRNKEILDLVEKQKKTRIKWVASVLNITEDSIRKSAEALNLIIEDDSIMIPSEAKDAIKSLDPKERIINEIIASRNSKKFEILKEKQEKFARIIAYTFSGDFISLDGRGGLNFLNNMKERLQSESIEVLRNYVPLNIYYKIYGYPVENISIQKRENIKKEIIKIDEKIKGYAFRLAKLAITEVKGKKISVYLPGERIKYYIADHYEHINYSLQVTYRSEIRETYYRLLDQEKIKSVTSEKGYYKNIDFTTLLYETAMNWMHRGYNRKVSLYLSLVLEENPELYNAYLNLVNVHTKLKEYNKAKEVLEKAKTKDENNPKLWSSIALIYLLEGNSKQFNESIEKAESIDKKFPELYIVRSRDFLLKKNVEEALNQIKKALELDEESIYAKELLIDIYYEKKDLDNAIDELVKITNEIKNPFLMLKLGKIYEEKGMDSEGFEIYNKALKYLPRNPELLKRLGELYLKMNKYQEAVNAFNRVLDEQKDDSQLMFRLGFTYKMLKDNESAIQFLENSLKINPDNSEGWELLGDIYQKIGNQKKAQECLKKAQRKMKKS
ncbi:MAG: tetratricopeptide repeat protein [Candidatus Heimdallarchaeota archaeon]|nr:tetratricopeptide repeat protein [Candidatus Heimdallarchaeota archaeon]